MVALLLTVRLLLGCYRLADSAMGLPGGLPGERGSKLTALTPQVSVHLHRLGNSICCYPSTQLPIIMS